MGYSTCAFNLVIPPTQPFPANLIKSYNPCYGFKPPSPLFDPRNSKGKARASDEPEILQLSRLTLTLDEATVKAGGGGIVRCFSIFFKFQNQELTRTIEDQFKRSPFCQL